MWFGLDSSHFPYFHCSRGLWPHILAVEAPILAVKWPKMGEKGLKYPNFPTFCCYFGEKWEISKEKSEYFPEKSKFCNILFHQKSEYFWKM